MQIFGVTYDAKGNQQPERFQALVEHLKATYRSTFPISGCCLVLCDKEYSMEVVEDLQDKFAWVNEGRLVVFRVDGAASAAANNEDDDDALTEIWDH